MRIGAIVATTLALLFCSALLGLFVWLVIQFAFMGALLAGITVLSIAYSVELEGGLAVGSGSTPDLFALQQQEQPASPEERASRLAERAKDLDAISIAKHVGAALVTIGALGFYFFQL